MTERFFKLEFPYDWWFIFDKKQEYKESMNLPFEEADNLVAMSEDQIIDVLNNYENDLRMCREKAIYWRNKANDIFGDMQTNVELERQVRELEKENEQLKQENMRLRKNQKLSIFDEDAHWKHYTHNNGYTHESDNDIRFQERTREALQRVEESDHKGMSVAEFMKGLEKR